MTQEQQADAIIRNHMVYSAGAAMIPIPIGDVLAVTMLQLEMVAKLAEVYDQRFSPTLGRSIITSLTGTVIARLGASAAKAIPVIGSLVGSFAQVGLAGASTFAVGELFKSHFAGGGTMDAFDPDRAREAYDKYVEKGRAFVGEMRAQGDSRESVASVAGTLQTLVDLKADGELTSEEFDRLKAKLLERV